MHHSILVFSACLAVLGAGCAHRSLSHAFPSVCPYGHNSVAAIPIFYGDGLTEENMRKFERHEIALGGCVREKDSPTESIRCGVCEFEFEPKSATWRRGSKDPDSFKPAISETLRSFTMPEPWSRGYGQAIYCDGEARESVTLIVLGKIAANETGFIAWRRTDL